MTSNTPNMFQLVEANMAILKSWVKSLKEVDSHIQREDEFLMPVAECLVTNGFSVKEDLVGCDIGDFTALASLNAGQFAVLRRTVDRQNLAPAQTHELLHTMDSLQPRRGDWYKSKSQPKSHTTKIRCLEYTERPGPAMIGSYEGTLWPGTTFGPVHEVDFFQQFVAVRVPSHFRCGTLVWVNIANKGQPFATMLPRIQSGFLD